MLDEAGLGVYVHWPFCKAKCPYCDFNSHVRHQPVNAVAFAETLVREIDYFASVTPDRVVSSVFFGGGTPSLMPPEAVASVIQAISAAWLMAPDAEITLEANPTSVEAARFEGYQKAGVNRVSVGVQALNNHALKFLGRQHSVAEALDAYRLAAKIFPRTSFDLIYARPRQTLECWKDELQRALDEAPDHMSLYQLTIEPGTPFKQLHDKGALKIPDDMQAADLYELTNEIMDDAGLSAYEVSNHARSGHECRHNLIYWQYGEYAGIGPGAHSRLIGSDGQRRALVVEPHPESWQAQVDARGHGIVGDELVKAEDAAHEYLLMGLRLSQGISLSRYCGLGGKPLDPARIDLFETEGLLARPHPDWICATRPGRLVLNSLIAELA